MKKHIANIISASRIVCAVILLFFNEITDTFLFIYLYCGFSDAVDGRIARKLGSTSVLGTKLDTVGDTITYFSVLKILIVKKLFPLKAMIWLGAALLLHVVAAVIAKIRFNKFYFVHSLFGKILGLAAFLAPFTLEKFGEKYLYFICIIASIAAVESIVIQLKSKDLQTDGVLYK